MTRSLSGRFGRTALFAIAALCASASPAIAQDTYPSREIRVIVPFPPGGTTDVVARTLGAKVGEALGKPVLVDNRAGASGAIGTLFGVRAAPDGYTLTFGNNQTHSSNASLFSKPGFDFVADLQPIALLTRTRHIVVVPASSPYRTLAELMAGGRQKNLTYASSSAGASSHLISETLCSGNKMRCTHVPYKGAAPAVLDLIAGHVDFMVASYASAVSHVRGGKLRGLAISGEAREPQSPDVPTFAELGHESLSADSWIGLYAPAKTPMPIVRRWSDELGRAIAQKEVKDKLEAAGFEVWFKPVDAFESFHRSELGRWKGMVETAGVKLD